MSNKNKILAYVISISFVFSAFLVNARFSCFDKLFYLHEHANLKLYGYSISEYIGISDTELNELTAFTLDYLNNPEATLDKKMNIDGSNRGVKNNNPVEVFTDDEKAHMVDVRKLSIGSMYLMYACLFIVFIGFDIYVGRKEERIFQYYKKTVIGAFAVFGLLTLWILIDFDSFWTTFHHIFFAGNDLWLLNLRTDVLIMIVPPEFFYHLVLRIIILFVLALLIFGLVLYLLEKKWFAND